MKITTLKATLLATIFLGLNACSLGHKNPLAHSNDEDAAKFLVAASQYAEVKIKNNQSDQGYAECMNGKLDSKTCHLIYKNMLNYAKTQSQFKTLSEDDLKDTDRWQNIKEYYAAKAFMSLPLPESAYK